MSEKTNKTETITEGLGIEEKFFETGQEMVKKFWGSTETVSDLLNNLAKEVRDEVLGSDIESSITSYEKKLILVGFFAGIIRERNDNMGSHLKKMVEMLKSSKDEHTEE